MFFRQVACTEDDVWFREYWRYLFDCSSDDECQSKQSLNQSTTPIDWNWGISSRNYDGVYVYAHAIHNAIAEKCPNAFLESTRQSEILASCLNGSTVLQYLKVRYKYDKRLASREATKKG